MTEILPVIPGVCLISPESHTDIRGTTSIPLDAKLCARFGFSVVQINRGFSIKRNTLRGLHFQREPYAQAKLVSCLRGAILNVAVDLRRSSPGFGRVRVDRLDAASGQLIYLPKGFAHGYRTLEDETLVEWCVDAPFCGEAADAISPLDPMLAIDWGASGDQMILSERDRNADSFERLFGRIR